MVYKKTVAYNGIQEKNKVVGLAPGDQISYPGSTVV